MIEFYLTCIGITILITQSSILEPFRLLFSKLGDMADELIHCAMCTGFWVGFFMSFLYNKDTLFSAATSSFLSWILFVAANFLFTITLHYQDKSSYEETDEI